MCNYLYFSTLKRKNNVLKMKNSKEFVRFAYSNAYFEGRFMKKQYSVGICTAKGDLSKRWYVWYYN